jgi:phage protein D
MPLELLLDNIAEPNISVQLMGVPLDAVVGSNLLDVSVTKNFDSADHMTMRLAAWDPDIDIAAYIDDSMFAPGVRISVAMGYGPGLVPVFGGDIVGYEMEMSGAERPVMSVECYGAFHRLGRRVPAPVQLTNRTYAAIVMDIAQRHRLIPDVQGDEAFQQNVRVNRRLESDQALVSALADEIGYECFVDDFDVLVFRKAEARRAVAFVITAAEMLQFSGRIDVAGQFGKVEAWSAGEKVERTNPDSFDYAYGGATSVATRIHDDALSDDQLDERADADLLQIREQYLAVNLTCFGRVDVRIGMGIAVAGVSRRFDGPYTITSLTHSFSPSQGFRTRMSLKGVLR